MKAFIVLIRWLAWFLILVEIGYHAHWSVTFLAVSLALRAEISDAKKRIQSKWRDGVSFFGIEG